MRKRQDFDINKIEEYYTITEDGRVWSKLKNRWLCPQMNNYGYIHYPINKGVDHCIAIFAHTLVALKYIGKPPSPEYEIDHKDDNKSNNHYTNLQWMTHSQNILKAYRGGREHYWLGKHRPSPALETLMLMANAKKKRVGYNGQTYESIQDLADNLTVNRKVVSVVLNHGGLLKGFPVTLIPD